MPPSVSISPQVWDVLSRSSLGPTSLHLPDEQLPRPLYESVNKVITALGGKWDRKAKAHLFPDSPGIALAEALESGSVTDPVKLFQFYPTPPEIADRLVAEMGVGPWFKSRFLEPSAGAGALVEAFRRAAPEAEGDVCELDPKHRPGLEALGCRVMDADFLQFTPFWQYPFIIANPPFTKGQAVRHASRMLDLLAPRGVLGCIMDAGVVFRFDAATVAFRDRLHTSYDHRFIELPEAAFKSSGTLVRTVLLTATPRL